MTIQLVTAKALRCLQLSSSFRVSWLALLWICSCVGHSIPITCSTYRFHRSCVDVELEPSYVLLHFFFCKHVEVFKYDCLQENLQSARASSSFDVFSNSFRCFTGLYLIRPSLGGRACLSLITPQPCSSNIQSRSPLVSNSASSSSLTILIFGCHTHLGTFTSVDTSGWMPFLAILPLASKTAVSCKYSFVVAICWSVFLNISVLLPGLDVYVFLLCFWFCFRVLFLEIRSLYCFFHRLLVRIYIGHCSGSGRSNSA